jgi:membrane protease YdiL (CAAX protease family)
MQSSDSPTILRSRRRDMLELAVAYGLILLVIWTPRPWQRMLWPVAAIFIAAVTYRSFESLKAMGLQAVNLLRSLWVVGAALVVAALAVFVAERLHTLHLPGSPTLFIETYAGYAIWACAQQFLLQSIFLARLLRLVPSTNAAALLSALIFAIAHLPNPILTAITLILGLASCLIFLQYRNLYAVALAHAILGIAIAVTIPGHVIHNMRVGLGYLTYVRRPVVLAQSPPRLTQP